MADEPRLHRPVNLAFRGDWGQANMHRICGWLAQEIGDRSPEGSQFAIWSGREVERVRRARSVSVAEANPPEPIDGDRPSGDVSQEAGLGEVPI